MCVPVFTLLIVCDFISIVGDVQPILRLWMWIMNVLYKCVYLLKGKIFKWNTTIIIQLNEV